MADFNELKTKIVLKNDTAANLSAKNPVLLKGEMCIEIDTNKFKFGDGVTAYNDLPYAVDITLDAVYDREKMKGAAEAALKEVGSFGS